jgi:hypothetical protein
VPKLTNSRGRGDMLCWKIRVFRLIAVLKHGPELTIVHSIGKPTPSKIENIVVADLRKLGISPKNLKGLMGNREI